MTTHDDDPVRAAGDPVRAAQDLTSALQAMAVRLDDVRRDSEERDQALADAAAMQARYERRSRLYIALDVLLTILFAAATWIAVNAASSASTATATAAAVRAELATERQENITSCQQGNGTRADELRFWDHLITLSEAEQPPPDETKAEIAAARKELAGLEAYGAKTFAPRDCAKLYSGRT